MTVDEAIERYGYEALHSVQADVSVLNPKSIADSAHRNFGAIVKEIEDLEYRLARAFSTLEKRQQELLEQGTRAEPDWEKSPLATAAHSAWLTNKVGKPPLPPPIVG